MITHPSSRRQTGGRLARITGVIAALGTCLVLSAPAAANLLSNGSFEDPLSPAWDCDVACTGNVASPDRVNWAPDDGLWAIDLNGFEMGYIDQTFATDVGGTYLLEFALSANWSNYETLTDNREVFVELYDEVTDDLLSSSFFSLDPTTDIPTGWFPDTAANGGYMGWTTQSIAFTATGASTYLAFISNTDGAEGVMLDNVRISAVAEPATTALLGLGLLGAGFARKRRSH